MEHPLSSKFIECHEERIRANVNSLLNHVYGRSACLKVCQVYKKKSINLETDGALSVAEMRRNFSRKGNLELTANDSFSFLLSLAKQHSALPNPTMNKRMSFTLYTFAVRKEVYRPFSFHKLCVFEAAQSLQEIKKIFISLFLC